MIKDIIQVGYAFVFILFGWIPEFIKDIKQEDYFWNIVCFVLFIFGIYILLIYS